MLVKCNLILLLDATVNKLIYEKGKSSGSICENSSLGLIEVVYQR